MMSSTAKWDCKRAGPRRHLKTESGVRPLGRYYSKKARWSVLVKVSNEMRLADLLVVS